MERDKGRFVKGNQEGKKFKPGEVTNPAGRPPLLCNVLKNLPPDAQKQAMDVLWTAISQRDTETAKKFLKKSAEELPECGFALQIAIRALTSSQGWYALMDIYDRLWGKPKQTAELENHVNINPPAIIIKGEDDE